MTNFKISIIINKPVETVVDALMNVDNFPYWQTDLKQFEVIAGKPGEVGSVGILHYSQNGREYLMEDKLLYCDPGKKYVSQVTGDVITAQVETNLVSIKDKTEMILAWSGKGKKIMIKILLPLLRKKLIKQTKKDLETFKRLIEKKGSNFNQ